MEENIGSEIVSMRCLRHKKRFNVPKEWLETSKWLCPHCFENLSEEGMQKYAPKNGTIPEVREAESGTPVRIPSFWMSGGKEVEDGENGKKTSRFCTKKEKAEKKNKPWHLHRGSIFSARSNPNLAELLPHHKIACQRCGEVVPCHYSWFNNSTVLCPSCYSAMSEFEIRRFHKSHYAARTGINEGPQSINTDKRGSERSIPREWGWDITMVRNGGCWSHERVIQSTEEELLSGLKAGCISKARYRSELRRRNNVEYYDMLPEQTGISPIFS